MKQISVQYCGWGEDWPLGRLADDGQTLLFEYSPDALAQELELSPLHLKLRPSAYGDFPAIEIMERMLLQAPTLSRRLADAPIRRATVREISSTVDGCRQRLEHER